MKKRNWTPVDNIVQAYGFKTGQTFTYSPGSGEASFKTSFMALDELKDLIKLVEANELRMAIMGEVTIYVPIDDEDEDQVETKPEIEEPVGKCPECGGPATHPSGLCRDCHQAKLEGEEEIPEEIVEAIEDMAEEDVVVEINARGVAEIRDIEKEIPEEIIEVMESARERVAKVGEIEEEKESSEEDAVVIIE